LLPDSDGSSCPQCLGNAWLEQGRGVAPRVPSIHSRSDFNVLLNPAHPDIRRVSVTGTELYSFDSRLY
jgi:RES domain-containing protein